MSSVRFFASLSLMVGAFTTFCSELMPTHAVLERSGDQPAQTAQVRQSKGADFYLKNATIPISSGVLWRDSNNTYSDRLRWEVAFFNAIDAADFDAADELINSWQTYRKGAETKLRESYEKDKEYAPIHYQDKSSNTVFQEKLDQINLSFRDKRYFYARYHQKLEKLRLKSDLSQSSFNKEANKLVTNLFKHISPNNEEGFTPLMIASAMGNTQFYLKTETALRDVTELYPWMRSETLKEMLQAHEHLSEYIPHDIDALSLACIGGHKEICTDLVVSFKECEDIYDTDLCYHFRNAIKNVIVCSNIPNAQFARELFNCLKVTAQPTIDTYEAICTTLLKSYKEARLQLIDDDDEIESIIDEEIIVLNRALLLAPDRLLKIITDAMNDIGHHAEEIDYSHYTAQDSPFNFEAINKEAIDRAAKLFFIDVHPESVVFHWQQCLINKYPSLLKIRFEMATKRINESTGLLEDLSDLTAQYLFEEPAVEGAVHQQ